MKTWNSLKKPTQSTMIPYFRYGMISSLSSIERQKSINKFKCLACNSKFISSLDARTHPCDKEEAFRKFTSRIEPLEYQTRKPIVVAPFFGDQPWPELEGIKPHEVTLTIDPESWVRWNSDLLEQNKLLKERVDELTIELKAVKSELTEEKNKNTQLIKSMQENFLIKIRNDQAEAYREYTRR